MNKRKNKLRDDVYAKWPEMQSPFMRELPPGYPPSLSADDEFMKRYGELQSKFYSEIEKRLNEVRKMALESPYSAGWFRLCELLETATKDECISASTAPREFVELMLDLASDAILATSAEEAIEPLADVLLREKQQKNAQSRNAIHRAWVQDEWKKFGDTPGGYGGNKTEFSKAYVMRLWNERNVKVSVDTMRDRWLKGL